MNAAGRTSARAWQAQVASRVGDWRVASLQVAAKFLLPIERHFLPLPLFARWIWG